MKTLHLNTERTWRGGEQQTLYLLQGLSKRGITSDLICQPDSPMAQRAGKAGLNVIPVVMHGEGDLVAAGRIRSFVRKKNYDVVHSHTSHAHTLAFAATLGLKIKRLVSRRVDFSIFRHGFLHLSVVKYRFMADYFIAISQKIKDVLVDDGIAAERIFVIHSAIDPQRFSSAGTDHLRSEFNLTGDEQVVINVAHLAGHKGQQHLVRAVPAVVAKIPNVRFFIIGKGELLDDLKRLAVSLGLKRQLVFTGFREDVGAFYNLADLFVMSSVQEGLGTAVLDALAAGIPVVAARAGGIPEIIRDGETGRLVEPADPPALAKGMVELLTHTERAQKMAIRGQKIVHQRFSIDVMVEKYLQIYQRILKESA